MAPARTLGALLVAFALLLTLACGMGGGGPPNAAVVVPATPVPAAGPASGKADKDITGVAPAVAPMMPAVAPSPGILPSAATVPPPPPGADTRAAARMAEYTMGRIAAGFVPHGAPGADTLSHSGASRDYTITLTAGDCYTLAAFGGAGVRDLDIYLNGPSGRQVSQDTATDSRPIVNTCVQETGAYRVRILMYDGHGPFTYQVYRAPGAAAQAVGIAGIDATVRRRMDQQSGHYVSHGFRPVVGLAGAGVLSQGQTVDYTIPIAQASSCYAFVGYAGSGMSDLDIYLYDGAGNQLRRDVAVDPVADVQQFVSTPGAYRISLNAYSGSGPFAYQVYERAGQACN